MKKTEQRWMHSQAGRFADRGINMSLNPEYEQVTVIRDVPEWEDVEVVQWACVDNGVVLSVHDTFEEARNWANQDKAGCNVIELKGIDRRRKPEPEVEAVERQVVDNTGWTGCVIDLPHEWIDKRVKVEVIEEAREK